MLGLCPAGDLKGGLVPVYFERVDQGGVSLRIDIQNIIFKGVKVYKLGVSVIEGESPDLAHFFTLSCPVGILFRT